MRLVLSQHHKDYEFRLLQAASGYEVSIADAQGKQRRGLDNTRMAARDLKKADA
jgi:hypothetical protein